MSNQKGVTLIELLAVLAILSVVIITISTVHIQFLGTYETIADASVNGDDISFFLDFFSKKVRNAEKINIRNNSVRLTDTSRNIVEFTYDSKLKTLSYINENGVGLNILEHVESFTGTNLTTNGKNGVQIIVGVKEGNQIKTYEIEVYSQIG